jgi:hypothetical protein
MKIIKPVFFLVIGCALLSSCGTVNTVNKTIILGSWKFEKVKSFTPASSEVNAALNGPSSIGDQSKSGSSKEFSEAADIKKMAKESVAENNISSLVARFPDLITAVEFRSDNTATLTSSNKVMNGTWKIDRSGTKVTFKEAETKKVTKLVLTSVAFTDLEINNAFPEGTFTLIYKNTKKK